MSQSKITRDDIESKFAAFQGNVEGKVQDRKQTLIAAAGAASLVLLILFFLLGRRSGKKKTTIVEIRRV
jgi:hypothetical protein